MAYQDKIAYEPTLGEALLSMFGGDADGGGSKIDSIDDNDDGTSDDIRSLINKAQNAYDKAIDCQKNGDWEGYGKYIKQLENYLTKLSGESNTGSGAAEPAAETPADASADAAAEEPAAEEPAAEDDAA